MLNLNFETPSQGVRFKIEDNVWNIVVEPKEVVSPPNGKELIVKYENGDLISVKFSTVDTEEEFLKKHGSLPRDLSHFSWFTT